VGHPFIQLAYAYEYDNKDVATEALSLACTEYDYIHKFLDHYPPDTSTYKSAKLTDILLKVRQDDRFDGYFEEPGFLNIFTVLGTREDALLEHWNAWNLDDFAKRFEDAYNDAVLLAIGTASVSAGYDFFLAHVLTVAHALRVLWDFLPKERQEVVFKQYWLWTLLIYIAQLRRPVDEAQIESIDLKGKSWEWVQEMGITGERSLDSHYVKVIRALKVAAETWPHNNKFYLKAAVKYISEFEEWTGFGKGVV
jgi:Questin oxidase-like